MGPRGGTGRFFDWTSQIIDIYLISSLVLCSTGRSFNENHRRKFNKECYEGAESLMGGPVQLDPVKIPSCIYRIFLSFCNFIVIYMLSGT